MSIVKSIRATYVVTDATAAAHIAAAALRPTVRTNIAAAITAPARRTAPAHVVTAASRVMSAAAIARYMSAAAIAVPLNVHTAAVRGTINFATYRRPADWTTALRRVNAPAAALANYESAAHDAVRVRVALTELRDVESAAIFERCVFEDEYRKLNHLTRHSDAVAVRAIVAPYIISGTIEESAIDADMVSALEQLNAVIADTMDVRDSISAALDGTADDTDIDILTYTARKLRRATAAAENAIYRCNDYVDMLHYINGRLNAFKPIDKTIRRGHVYIPPRARAIARRGIELTTAIRETSAAINDALESGANRFRIRKLETRLAELRAELETLQTKF